MITAVLTSDNHLGAYYARFRPDRLEGRRRALQRGFKRVVDAALGVFSDPDLEVSDPAFKDRVAQVLNGRVDLFLHAGALFDRPDPRNAERLFVARQVRRLQEAGIPVFAIAGNHDSPRSLGYDGGTLPQEEMDALGAIRLFGGRERLEADSLQVNGHRVCVWGMSSDFNRPNDVCPLEECGSGHARGGDLDLVLLHYGVEGWARTDVLEPCLSRQNLERLEADAVCVGHLHARK